MIGLGNELRGDDGAGIEVARRVAATVGDSADVVFEQGEALRLLEKWDRYPAAIVVDAVCGGGAPGTVHRLDATHRPLDAAVARSASTHAVSLAEAIELARALGRLPQRMIVYGLEGSRFAAGDPMSAPMRHAVATTADAILRELQSAFRG